MLRPPLPSSQSRTYIPWNPNFQSRRSSLSLKLRRGNRNFLHPRCVSGSNSCGKVVNIDMMMQAFREELEKQYTQDEKEEVWSEAAEAVKTYHEEMVAAWDKEMDTLLVYVSSRSFPWACK